MKRVALALGATAALVIAGAFGVIYWQRSQLAESLALTGPRAVNSLEQVELGGRKQYILIRGEDRRNPVLLFLHGGPGGSVLADSHLFSRELEKHFVVVHWDQRGAGKSFDANMRPEDYRVDHFVSDGIQLIEQLRRRFEEDKVYLVGHSWGTVLGTLIAAQRPDLLKAYVGAGQVVSQIDNELQSYGYAKKWAEEAGDRESLALLAKIKPPYNYEDSQRALSELVTQRKILWKHLEGKRKLLPGHVEWGGLWGAAISPYYSPIEAYRTRNAEFRTIEIMWPMLMQVDLRKQVPELKVPVYFIEGRYDYQVVAPLAEDYFRKLKAPEKELIWMENSGHDMMYDQPKLFQDIIIDRLLHADATPAKQA